MKNAYSALITKKSTRGLWPAMTGIILENDISIGTFKRAATRDNFVPPIKFTFRTAGARARFEDFADSLSIAETIEALL